MTLHHARVLFAVCAFGAVVGKSHTAQAQPARGDCPPEDWFCADDATDAGAPELAPEPAPDGAEPPPSPAPRSADPPATPPPPGMSSTGKIDLRREPPDGDGEFTSLGQASPWSVSLRLQGVALGSGRHDSALGGIGVSLRYFVHPSVALDLGFDSFGGTDYNGYDRSEGSLSGSALVVLNPERPIRTYLVGGLSVSGARVDKRGDEQSWSYFGAHAGLGLEFLVNPSASLSVDMIGFLRGRTDARAAREPEFTDGFGNLTNLSGGGLFRGAVSLYW